MYTTRPITSPQVISWRATPQNYVGATSLEKA